MRKLTKTHSITPTTLKCLLLLMTLLMCMPLKAQQMLYGYIIDEQTRDSIPFASATYKRLHKAVSANMEGRFSIPRMNGNVLTFSAIGYHSQSVTIDQRVKSPMRIYLKPNVKALQMVTVKPKRQRYSRKNNPAVELMRRVIERKRQTHLDNHDFYQYNKYQKLTLAANEITEKTLQDPRFQKHRWLVNHVEKCQYNNKMILPLSVDETVTQVNYRRTPYAEKNITKGMRTAGIGNLFQTGDILTTMLKEIFTDVNIYDDQVKLLQARFTSPIGKDAISFYRYNIVDTLMVGGDRCIQLHFVANNVQDFGFHGEIYVMADSSYQVKRCELAIPKRSDVNFVDKLTVNQEFTKLDNGEWVLSTDDMVVELSIVNVLQKAIVMRNTRLTDYRFDELPHQVFRGKAKDVKDPNALIRNEQYWAAHRKVPLTKGEQDMDNFLDGIQKANGFKFHIILARLFIENFIETDKPSKVDIGPVSSMVSSNYIDGLRTRFGAKTTANLNKHWFFSGYLAHGWKSNKTYYKGEVTYSLNEKEYMPHEFPQRTITFSSTYDVSTPTDKLLSTDKDNMFTAMKWSKVDAMMFYNRQKLTFEHEQDWGLKMLVSLETERDKACGSLRFTPMNEYNAVLRYSEQPSHAFRTTEVRAALEFCPGQTYINTKQRRVKTNNDSPVFSIGHTIGLKNVLGGDYRYNYTEASIYKRFWASSWGRIEGVVKGGVQWNKVPFTLLCMPEANLSYFRRDHTFSLVNNMEFLNDRYLFTDFTWDMNGKLFNRIPFLKELKWRELISMKMLWGTLSDKNNPLLPQNANDPLLMQFPRYSYVMDSHRPYCEVAFGVYNIFKLFHVEYVRRLNYNSLPTSPRDGVRVAMEITF